jgi:GNAT superfamily N-acetyltransferase
MPVELPLNKTNRIRIARVFRAVPRVDLSIDCVVEGQMGRVLVDEIEKPHSFMLQAGPFVYFAGTAAGPGAADLVRTLGAGSLVMPSAQGWVELIRSVHGDRLARAERHSFSSESLSADNLLRICRMSPYDGRVRKMGEDFFSSGLAASVQRDLAQFDSTEDFIKRGVGYYVEDRGRLAGTAFSSLVCSKGIEVSIFVSVEHRRKGLASSLGAYLLMWCLENGIEPHWDAANPESCRLAEKLGYERSGTYRAHILASR